MHLSALFFLTTEQIVPDQAGACVRAHQLLASVVLHNICEKNMSINSSNKKCMYILI